MTRDPPTPRDIRNRLNGVGPTNTDPYPEEVELAGVPGTPLDEDGLPIEGDEDGPERRGDDAETISVPIPPVDENDDEGGPDAPEDREECPECGVNPIEPRLDGALCLACHGLPRRDWPPYLVDPDGEEGGDRE